jgi:hypothetical protein
VAGGTTPLLPCNLTCGDAPGGMLYDMLRLDPIFSYHVYHKLTSSEQIEMRNAIDSTPDAAPVHNAKLRSKVHLRLKIDPCIYGCDSNLCTIDGFEFLDKSEERVILVIAALKHRE